MLQYLGPHRFEPGREGGFREGGDDRQPHRHPVLARQADEAVERGRGRRRVVVPPPQRGDPTLGLPGIELAGEIGPVHGAVLGPIRGREATRAPAARRIHTGGGASRTGSGAS